MASNCWRPSTPSYVGAGTIAIDGLRFATTPRRITAVRNAAAVTYATSAAFSPDGHTLAADHTVQLWDATNAHDPRPLGTVSGHPAAINWVAFSPDGHTLATAGGDRLARLTDITDPHNPQPLAVLAGHTKSVNAVTFSPDGHTVATASSDSTVRLWNLADPRQPTLIEVRPGHANSVFALAFSPDGATLVTASLDTTTRLEDLPGPAIVVHSDIIWSVSSAQTGAPSPPPAAIRRRG